MALTYVAIATTTVGAGGASSISFTSIPQTYTDLKISLSGRTTYNGGPGDNISVTLNGNAVYGIRTLYGTGSSVVSGYDPFITNSAGATANTFGNADFYFPNYTSSNNKTVSFDGVTENNATLAYQFLTAGLWTTTSAITSISLAGQAGGSTWTQYSTATLYGIKNTV
jgi:hypothetical protein